MPVIRTAAAPDQRQLAQGPRQAFVAGAQFQRVTRIQGGAIVQLRVALAGGICAQTANAIQPGTFVRENMFKVRRMRAVDLVVGGISATLRIHLFYGGTQRLTGRQVSVGFHGEGYGDRHAPLARGFNYPQRLFHIIQRVGGHQIRRCIGKGAHLQTVIIAGLCWAHQLSYFITIAARAYDAAYDQRPYLRLPLSAQIFQQGNRPAVDFRQLRLIVSQVRTPIGVCPPGGGLQYQAAFLLSSYVRIAAVIAPQNFRAFGFIQQSERGKCRQIHAFVINQRGFHTAVTHQYMIVQLRQLMTIYRSSV
jgi:hypothetical protein